MHAIAPHPDVLVVRSAVWQTNCAIVRGGAASGEEVFVIDSPVLPEELAMLAGLPEQVGMAPPSALMASHADWDHLLGRLAFPDLELGLAESSLERLRAHPGAAQRELRDFDEQHYVERGRPLTLGTPQALPVPGRCEIGPRELELYPADGHTADGMAIWVPWAGVLMVGDYLARVELPVLGEGGSPAAYLQTLERLRELVDRAEHVVPGHGAVLGRAQALELLDEDALYVRALLERGAAAPLPAGRRSRTQRGVHAQNVAAVSRS
jgi:glyoxylase-like metal-dependent hydrolase (beta-lactamase superfamily II)